MTADDTGVRHSDRPIRPEGILRTSAVVGFFMVLTNLFLIGVALVSARELGPSGRGVLVLIIAIGSMTGILAGMGTHVSARIRLVSPVDPIAIGDVLGLSFALAGLAFLLCGLVSIIVLPLTHVPRSPAMVLLAGGYGSLLLLATLLGQALYGIGCGPAAAGTESVGTLLQLVGLVALGFLRDRDVLHYVIVLAAGEGVQSVLIVAVFFRIDSHFHLSASHARWRELVVLGLPALFIGVSQGLSLRLDRFLTGVFLRPKDVGIYSVASTITEGLWLAPIALAQVLFHQTAAQAIDRGAVRRLRRYSLLLTVGLGVVVFFAAAPAIDLALGSAYLGAVTPLKVLLLGAVGMASYYVDSMILMGGGHVRAAATAAAAGVALITAGDWILIPRFGILGAAYASALGYLAMGAIGRIMLQRLTP